MKLVPFAKVPPTEWDGLVAGSAQGWIFHRSSWIGIEAKFGNAEVLAFGLESQGRLVAAQPLYSSQIGLGTFSETLIHAGVHRHAGLALAPDLTAADIAAARTVSMNAILEVARTANADRIYLAHQNLSPESRSPQRGEIPFWVTDFGFELGNSFGPGGLAPGPGLATTVVDQIVDLAPSEDELFAGLEESCRRAVRKGLKAGCTAVDVGSDAGSIDEYWRLAQLSAERTGEQLADREFFEAIRAALAPDASFAPLFVKSGDHLVAGAIVLRDKGASYFFSGVSDPAHLASRVNDVLHWSIMLRAKQQGDAVYRLGPYFPSVPRDWPIEKVSRFKTKFGGKPWTIVQGSRYLRPERYADLAQAHVSRLCRELAQ